MDALCGHVVTMVVRMCNVKLRSSRAITSRMREAVDITQSHSGTRGCAVPSDDPEKPTQHCHFHHSSTCLDVLGVLTAMHHVCLKFTYCGCQRLLELERILLLT